MDSGTSPGGSQIKMTWSGEGKTLIPGPHSSILQTGGRSQDTAYRILHATWLNFKKDEGHIGCRKQTPQSPRSLVAPLKGAGGYPIYLYISIIFGVGGG